MLKLMPSLAISLFLYACESETSTAVELEQRKASFRAEMQLKGLLNIL